MKAIVCTRYGPPKVLQLKEVAQPAPKDDEVRIRVHAASVNARDWRMMRAHLFIIRMVPDCFLQPKNKILGADVAGRLETIGCNVKQFRPADEVFGYLPSATGRGTFAEYVCAEENAITLKPANLSFDQAAAVPLAAFTVLQGLRDKGNIRAAQKVLVQNASGGVGTFAVQIAKAFGAEATGVCSTRNLEVERSIGADHVIDSSREDFTRRGQQYDLILAANGYHPVSDYLRALTPGGICVVAGGSLRQLFQAAVKARRRSGGGSPRTRGVSLVHRHEDLMFLRGFLESGQVNPVIDGCYPLRRKDEAIKDEAMRYLEETHAKGKVVITVEHRGGRE
jgi:NADPH:quinone reductase-like Zn-dependent oxidoreductase